MKDDPEVLRLKKLWEGAKDSIKKLGSFLSVSGEEAMEDLGTMAPGHDGPFEAGGGLCRGLPGGKAAENCADFSDQEHLALELLVAGDGQSHGAGPPGGGALPGNFGG